MKIPALYLCVVSIFTASVSLANWPAWRGPLANGTAPDADPPLEWSDTKNVKWKVKIPGSGSASPVIWGNRVFLLTAVTAEKPAAAQPQTPPPAAAAAENQPAAGGPGGPGGPGGERRRGGGRGQQALEKTQFTILCLDRATGKTLWQKVAREEVPHEGHHQDHGFASPSPVTDGQVVLAYFGSRGLHCYDLDGNLKWSKDFGQMRTRNSFGEGASPAIHGDYVIVNWDHEGDDFITALDRMTGKELWRTPRQEETSWGTPLIVDYKGQKQVIVNATTKVRSYDLATGKELWVCGGQTGNAIPCSVADADTVYAISGFRSASLQAIQLGRTGDLTGTDAIRWSYDKNTPYVPSPVLVGNRLYFISQRGAMITAFDTKAGQPLFEAQRIEGFFNAYASPVAAKDRVYVLNREGKCAVLKAGDKFEVLTINSIPEGTDATIALVGKELFLRGKENLYCIAEN
jgi:outer membrane protein assembly factor BamB